MKIRCKGEKEKAKYENKIIEIRVTLQGMLL